MNARVSTYMIMCVMVLLAVSCGADHYMKKGEKFLAIGEYYDAAEEFKVAYNKTPTKERAKRGERARKLAYCYDRINSNSKAIAAYRNVIRYKKDSTDTHLALARLLMKAASYKEAAKEFQLVLDSLPDNELAKTGLLAAQTAQAEKEAGSRYIVKKMDIFNSRRADYSPMLFGDEYDQLYFTSTRNEAQGDELSGITGTKPGDIFFSQKDENGKWQRPETIESGLNTEFDEGACCFTPDQSEMYLTQCVTDPNYPRFATIATSARADASWGKPQTLEITRDTLSSYAHPAISPDGLWLYFTSDMPGGKGGLDIWRIRLTEAGLGGVENLGEPVNTPGDEMFPYVRDSVTLYFASSGHPGMGGLDLFRATQDSTGHWRVENMGYPINSSSDDFGITFAGAREKGFFSSNRNDARGFDHLYEFEKPVITVHIEGYVNDVDEYPIQDATVQIVGRDGLNAKVLTNRDGEYMVELERDIRYVMMASARGYLNQNYELHTGPEEKSETYIVDFFLSPINKPVVIDNIFYDFDKASLRPESKKALDELIKMLNDNPNVTIELRSHTDRKGTDQYNERLAQRRAQSVVDYLIAAGIASDRLEAKGYGESVPKVVNRKIARQYEFLHEGDTLTEAFVLKLAPEQQEIADQLNRRTEFKVLRTNYNLF